MTSMDTKNTRSWLPVLGLAILLAAWTGWLRAPSINAPMWNVDETIHAAAARQLLDGGLMYRDTIDQRTPLTYYVFAAIFRVAGINNLAATRIVLGGMIVAIGLSLFLIGRRIRQTATGVWASLIFTAIASYLIYPGDAFAAHTEWFVILFTTTGALLFFGTEGCPSLSRSVAVGAVYGLAFLSKQTALIDSLVPLGTLAWLGLTRHWSGRAVLRSATGIALGLVAVTAAVVLYFVLRGAGRDLLFYTWTYNLKYYGPEVAWTQRLLSCGPFFIHLRELYPVVLVASVAGLAILALRTLQLNPKPALVETRASDCFLLLWCITSFGGAISSGRGFDHYFIQCMPPLAWLAAWLPGWLTRRLRQSLVRRPIELRWTLLPIAALLAVGLNVAWTSAAARKVSPFPNEQGFVVADFILEHTRPDEKIFVWGYSPDIYFYANRAPASRYLYCTFQTGLIPWTNVAPDKDTSYAIVPGAMDTLLRDLRAHRPKIIVDCGLGPHRHFGKYPLANFEPLRRFVEEDYVEVDPPSYRHQGFRVLMARDRTPSSPTPVESNLHPQPYVKSIPILTVGPNAVAVSADARPAAMRRLALVVDGAEFAAVRFPTSAWMRFEVPVPMPPGNARHRFEAVAEWTDGTKTTSLPVDANVIELSSTSAQRAEFAIRRMAGSLPADGVRALADARMEMSGESHVFQLHAPSLLRYTLPTGALSLRGRFGIRAGAYAPENKSPTDGAVFIVRVISPQGSSHVVFNRHLQPAREAGDRPVQNFETSLDRPPAGSTLELEINSGPDGSSASDWTYWSDIELETSP